MKLYRACIFDMDGTILNTLDSIAHFGNTALQKLGLPPIPTPQYKTLVGDGADMLMCRMLKTAGKRDAGVDALAALRMEYDALYAAAPHFLVAPYPGIPQLLAQKKAQGMKLGVLSNKPDDMVRLLARHFFPGMFDNVQGQLEHVPKKPDPAALLQMIAGFGCTPQQVLYCGDSGVDMQTGKNANVKSCGVLWGFRSKEELEGGGADFLAENTKELCEILNA